MKKRNSKKDLEQYLSKENLIRLFAEGYSANYIATKYFYPDFTTHASTVIETAARYGIKTYSVSEASKLSTVRKQYKETCKAKYGYENVSQNTEIKQKKIDSAIKKYGCINVFQAQEIKNKSIQTKIDKYGGTTIFIAKQNKVSNFQKEVFERILYMGYDAKLEVYNKFCKYSDCYGRHYSPIVDILIEDYKLVIECQGDIFHANPKIYKASDIIVKYKGPTKAEDIWAEDKNRIKHIESFGYKVIELWHSEYKHNKQIIERLISEYIEDFKNRKDS